MAAFHQIWYRAAKSKLRLPLTWVRHWGLDAYDVFIASYPRSGNTWLRFVLFEILASRSAGFNEVNHVIPEVGLHVKGLPLLPGEGRLIKTHEPYRPQYQRAIYLVRDVRDVVISEHAYQKGLGWISIGLDKFVLPFLQGEVNPFSPWQDHLGSWLDANLAKRGDLLLIKFEQMRQNTEQTVVDVLGFLGVDVGYEVVRAAVANNTVDRMKKKEDRDPQFGDAPPKPNCGEENRFIRGGSVGGWRKKLTPAQVALIEKYSGRALERMGYPLGCGDEEAAEARLNIGAGT